jgi:hypothetical protein
MSFFGGKTGQCQNWIFNKKDAVVIIWKKPSYFLTEKMDFRVGPPYVLFS